VAPAYQWMNETPTRVPLTDWYDTVTGSSRDFRRGRGGGLFIKMLTDRGLEEYSGRAEGGRN